MKQFKHLLTKMTNEKLQALNALYDRGADGIWSELWEDHQFSGPVHTGWVEELYKGKRFSRRQHAIWDELVSRGLPWLP